MINVSGVFDSVLGVLSQVTTAIRGLVESIIPGYATIALLVLGLAGGYYLAKKYPSITGYWAIAVYGLLFFLTLKFV